MPFEQVEAEAREAPAGGHDHALGAAFGHGDVRRDRVGSVEQVGCIALRQSGHRPRIDELVAPGGEARTRGRDPGTDRRIQRKHLILLGLFEEHRPHFFDLLRVLGGDVVGLVPAFVEIVKLEHLVVERVGVGLPEGIPRCAVHLGAHQPAFVIQRVLAHHFEVLRLVPRRLLGVLLIEGVGEARALDRFLLDAVHIFRGGDAGDFQQRGHVVDHMDELLAQAPLVLNALRPRDHHVLVRCRRAGRRSV